MVQTSSVELHEGVFTNTVTTNYTCGAIAKRYLDKSGMPFETVWVKPLVSRVVQPENIIEHREVQLYNHYFNQ